MKIKRNLDSTSINVLSIDSKSKNVIFAFAGFSYTIYCPLLYYIGNIAFQYKIDFIGFDLDYSNNDFFNSKSDAEQNNYFSCDIELIKKYIVSKDYSNRFFAGKSLGTTIINRLMDKNIITEKDKLIYITPGTEWNKIINNIEKCNNKALIIGSRNDSSFTAYDYSALYKNKNIIIKEYEKENHIMETGNIDNDLCVLTGIMKNIECFIYDNI